MIEDLRASSALRARLSRRTSSTLLLDGPGLSELFEWRIFALWLAANR